MAETMEAAPSPLQLPPKEEEDAVVASPLQQDDDDEERDEDDYEIDDQINTTKTLQRPYKRSIPELLAIRQEYGVSALSLPAFARPRNLMTGTLASKIAWNPSRLQNMILTVGPGTPAAIVDLSVEPSPPAAVAAAATAAARSRNPPEDDSSCSSSSSSSNNSSVEEEEEEEALNDADNGNEEPEQEQTATGATPTPDIARRPPSESSASSSSTTSPKRTLSDRMKMPEDSEPVSPPPPPPQDQQPRQPTPKHDTMNLDTASCDDDDNESNDHHDGECGGDEDMPPKNDDTDEEMMGYSDIEKELLGETKHEGEDEDKAEEDKTGDDEEGEAEMEEKDSDDDDDEGEILEDLTARERFYLEVNEAEENRMEFGNDSNDDDDEDDDDNDDEAQEENDDEAQEENDDDGDDDDDHPPPARTRGGAESTDEDGAGGDEEEDDDEEMADFREMAAEWFAMEQAEAEGDDVEDESDDDDEDDSDDDRAAARIIIRRRIMQPRSPSAAADESHRNNNNTRNPAMKPSLRHGGCINTAAWMQAGWRLSTVSNHHYSTSYNANYLYDADGHHGSHLRAISSDDCPTQLVTSGDDRLVKFWDVRHAMGSANPLPWGRNTYCPFASTPDDDGPGYKAKWREFYHRQKPVESWKMLGNVLPLATLNTGHRGNVFHVTPLWQQPGKVATCGADGYLRLGDVETSSSGDSSSSSIIISPEYFDGGIDSMMSGIFSLRPGMCFSHHFLNSNVGLLCTERGLRNFDIRLPPRQQERRAVLGGNTGCKACAVWTVSSATTVEEVDSTYVFVGGTGAEVALCDLRMTGGDVSENSRVVCQYRPKSLAGNEEVSVSGLDLSRDKKELLVSYESDQIYTFPIFPNAKSAAGPTLEEIDGAETSNMMNDDDDGNAATNGCVSMIMNGREERRRSGDETYMNELASYGGHLNRFTFLKNAKYAGPNDEYICTGSDSGHAWIYERATGAVVSLLNADNSTCNGVVPHPSLPFFITYGIDSTAKLWRATGPVDSNTDDSRTGRAKASLEGPYEMSPLTRDWDTIETEISNIEQELAEADAAREEDEVAGDVSADEGSKRLSQSYNILPDQVLSRKELINRSSFGRSILRRFYTPGGAGCNSRLGNDLHSLPDVLRRNQYECIRAAVGGGVGRRSDLPVESDLKELMRRVSLIRLRHQADRQGVSGRWNPNLPWIMDTTSHESTVAEEDDAENENTSGGIHPADLVPDNPSDWIPYDPEMSERSRPCGASFNCEEYGDFYRERYLHSDKDDRGTDNVGGEPPSTRSWSREASDGKGMSSSPSASENAYRILHETARVLKDGGNEALRKGELDIAARRYDKAIRYCAVAFMSRNGASTYGGKYEDELMLMSIKMIELDIESEHRVTPLMLKWSPLLKVLISTRLNLSMLLLKQAKHQKEMPQLEQAADQAMHALRELQPFCTQKGKVCVSYVRIGGGVRLCATECFTHCGSRTKVKTEVLKSQEPQDTYKEAKTLEAKAYFRLGSVQSDMGEYGEAIKCFDKSVECTLALNPDAKLDPLVVRRLAEAKREKMQQTKRHRKKFRMMFAQDDDEGTKNKSKTQRRNTTVIEGCARQGKRRTRAVLPVVSPATPGAAARTPNEDRGTQSE